MTPYTDAWGTPTPPHTHQQGTDRRCLDRFEGKVLCDLVQGRIQFRLPLGRPPPEKSLSSDVKGSATRCYRTPPVGRNASQRGQILFVLPNNGVGLTGVRWLWFGNDATMRATMGGAHTGGGLVWCHATIGARRWWRRPGQGTPRRDPYREVQHGAREVAVLLHFTDVQRVLPLGKLGPVLVYQQWEVGLHGCGHVSEETRQMGT